MLNVSFSLVVLGCHAFVVSRSLFAAQPLASWPKCRNNRTSGRGEVTEREGDVQRLVAKTSAHLDKYLKAGLRTHSL